MPEYTTDCEFLPVTKECPFKADALQYLEEQAPVMHLRFGAFAGQQLLNMFIGEPTDASFAQGPADANALTHYGFGKHTIRSWKTPDQGGEACDMVNNFMSAMGKIEQLHSLFQTEADAETAALIGDIIGYIWKHRKSMRPFKDLKANGVDTSSGVWLELLANALKSPKYHRVLCAYLPTKDEADGWPPLTNKQKASAICKRMQAVFSLDRVQASKAAVDSRKRRIDAAEAGKAEARAAEHDALMKAHRCEGLLNLLEKENANLKEEVKTLRSQLQTANDANRELTLELKRAAKPAAPLVYPVKIATRPPGA